MRRAEPDDVPELVDAIVALADYERSADQVRVDERLLNEALFAEHPAVFAHVADVGGRVEGMAIWFLNYSTWTGRHGIYLEDLFVRSSVRGRGVGRALMVALAREAAERGYARVDWSVLRWNERALGFYRSLGARPLDDWVAYRLDEEGIARLAAD